jgi:DNA modification methylase
MAVWNKGSGGMGGLYRSAHELIPVFCNGASPRVNNIQLGKHGRDRTNVFSYPGANRRGSAAGEALKDHPTPKPADMVNDAIIDVTNPGELVFDPFLGSGTTLLAAERAGRLACCIELDPRYVDVAIARWEAETGQSAVHDETDLTFAELRQARTGDADE